MSYDRESLKDLEEIKKQVEVQIKKAESRGNQAEIDQLKKYLSKYITPKITLLKRQSELFQRVKKFDLDKMNELLDLIEEKTLEEVLKIVQN